MCYFCHVQRAEMYDDVVFVHQRHVEQGQLDCLRCHPRIRHGHIKMAERLPL
jgi:predicted glutamine amidotransferase